MICRSVVLHPNVVGTNVPCSQESICLKRGHLSVCVSQVYTHLSICLALPGLRLLDGKVHMLIFLLSLNSSVCPMQPASLGIDTQASPSVSQMCPSPQATTSVREKAKTLNRQARELVSDRSSLGAASGYQCYPVKGGSTTCCFLFTTNLAGCIEVGDEVEASTSNNESDRQICSQDGHSLAGKKETATNALFRQPRLLARSCAFIHSLSRASYHLQ